MLPAHLGDAEAVQRFLREARACARLKGEHVAKVHDVGRLENGAPYMIMEYLTGGDLRRRARAARGAPGRTRRRSTSSRRARRSPRRTRAGIVHRDLKPENLFLTKGPGGIPSIKVLDFGISKRSARRRQRATCA